MRSPVASARVFAALSLRETSPQSPVTWRPRKRWGSSPLSSRALRAPGVATTRPGSKRIRESVIGLLSEKVEKNEKTRNTLRPAGATPSRSLVRFVLCRVLAVRIHADRRYEAFESPFNEKLVNGVSILIGEGLKLFFLLHIHARLLSSVWFPSGAFRPESSRGG